MMKNGPNGRYVLRLDPLCREQGQEHDPRDGPGDDDRRERATTPDQQADADQELHVTHAQGAGTERQRGQVQQRPG